MTSEKLPEPEGMDFQELYRLLRTGDQELRNAALTRLIPLMLGYLEKCFGSMQTMDRNAAMASAARTILDRKFELGDELENWGHLAGKFILFARHKALNHMRKRRPKTGLTSANDGDGPKTPELADPTPSLDELEACREAREQVHHAMNQMREELDELQWLILRYKYEGLTWEAMRDQLAGEQKLFKTADHLRYQWNSKIAPRLQEILTQDDLDADA